MFFTGQFRDIKDNMITVYIQTDNSRSEIVKIGEEGGDIFFDKDPIDITMDVDNTFDVLITKTMELNLLSKKYLGDKLFTGDPRNCIINVWKGGDCIFAGFIEPNIYTQPFDHYYDKLTLNCTDAISTLQYYNYGNINDEATYKQRKNGFGEITFSKIIYESLREIQSMNLQTGAINNIYYDGSVLLDSRSTIKDIFSQIKVVEMLWLGDEFDDLMTQDEVLEEILKFLDLKVRQEGCNFYIYSLQSIFSSRTINWYPICLPNYYIREDSRYSPAKTASANPREILVNVVTGEEREGNELEKELSDKIETRIDNSGNVQFVNYYYVKLPNDSKVKTEQYEVASSTGKDVLHINGEYKILEQSAGGSFNADKLRPVNSSQVTDSYVVTDKLFNDDDPTTENKPE